MLESIPEILGFKTLVCHSKTTIFFEYLWKTCYK